jgi:predicted phage terminase large subunit-like protein
VAIDKAIMNQDIEQTNGSLESNETKRRPWNKRLTLEEIEALPNTQRELSEKEINAAKELYFEHMSAGEIARTMNNMGWTEFETSELVGNHGRGMKGLASGLSWRVQRDEIERAIRAEETIGEAPATNGHEKTRIGELSTTPSAEADATSPNQGGELFTANGREGTRIEKTEAQPLENSCEQPERQSLSAQHGGKPQEVSAPPSFSEWLKRQEPQWFWNWPYQRYIYKALKRIETGKSKRLMIFLPPRHGKSELVTVRFAAWLLSIKPETKIIIGSYNQKLANRFSRKARRIHMNAILGKDSSVDLPPGGLLKTADDWETTAGGGVKAVGVGAGVTGFGANLIIVDDPIKSRAEANSDNNRERIWDWFNDDLYTRLEPNGAIILIQTRWHEDDLAGRLLKAQEDGGEKWEVIRLPALAEEVLPANERGSEQVEEGLAANGHECTQIGNVPAKTQSGKERGERSTTPPNQGGEFLAADKSVRGPWRDPLGRKPGEALCPRRFSREALLEKKMKMGTASFESLYQQNPVPQTGGLFKLEWFDKIVAQAPPGLKWYRGYDLAVSTKTSADYTASVRVAQDAQGNIYIADMFRMRAEYPEQRKFIIERMQAEKNTEHGIEEALHGKAIIQDLRRERHLTRQAFRGVKVTADKMTRAAAWASRAEEGKVILVRGSWIPDFLDELAHFPNGRYDDQIDAVSVAVQMVDRPKYRHAGF